MDSEIIVPPLPKAHRATYEHAKRDCKRSGCESQMMMNKTDLEKPVVKEERDP